MKLIQEWSIIALGLTEAVKTKEDVYYKANRQTISVDEIRALNQRCACADQTVADIKSYLNEYSSNKLNNTNLYHKPNVDAIVSEIKQLAYECTSKPECRCPEGYSKSKDNRCLSISRSAKTCMQAVKSCRSKYHSRLAVAKDPESLANLQNHLFLTNQTQNYYWIGLTYEKSEQSGHQPNWRWDDYSYATQHTKAAMGLDDNLNVKKAAAQLRMLDIKSTFDKDLVRVAIKANDEVGISFETGFCTDELNQDVEVQKFRYICEFLMFQVDITPRSSGKEASLGRL